MKQFLKPAYLPWAALGGGVIAFACRLWLFSMGRDALSLLYEGTFPDIMSWIIVAITLALLGFGSWYLKGEKKYPENFSASPIGAIAMGLTGICFVFSSVMGFIDAKSSLDTIGCILGLLSAGALFLLAWHRFKGLRPNILLHCLVCVYLMVYLVSHYQGWSSDPQLQTYAFELFAIVFTMLGCYQRAAFDIDQGDRRAYSFFSLAALFFSLATLPGCEDPVFFMGCAVWMFFTPCRMTLPEPKEN